jgi:LacI family transcriptional regulator
MRLIVYANRARRHLERQLATIKDVAERAHVSVATVSHVINGTRPVSDELRTRVQEAMEALHYRPNRLARSLRRGETKTLGMMIPDINEPFFTEIARHVEDCAYEKGYSVILCNTDRDPSKALFYTRLLVERQVDGIVFVAISIGSEPAPGGDQLASIRARMSRVLKDDHVPIVVIERDWPDYQADAVLADNVEGGKLAVRHLAELGHRRIGCIRGGGAILTFEGRLLGYSEGLAEMGIELRPDLVVEGSVRLYGGYRATRQLLALDEPPTAIFANNDLMGIGAIHAAGEMGIRVPDDVSVVGFDDVRMASLANPGLTTIAQPKREMSEHAIDMLLARIREPGRPIQREVLPVEVIRRGSTAPPATG